MQDVATSAAVCVIIYCVKWLNVVMFRSNIYLFSFFVSCSLRIRLCGVPLHDSPGLLAHDSSFHQGTRGQLMSYTLVRDGVSEVYKGIHYD